MRVIPLPNTTAAFFVSGILFASALTQNDTSAPTTNAPSAATVPGSAAPSKPPQDTTPAPTTTTTAQPSTAAPTAFSAPTARPSHHYVPPIPDTDAPSMAPVQPSDENNKGSSSLLRMAGKAFGWLLLIALSVLLFGAVMSNRYRIFYVLRGVWYTILRLGCTRWIIRKYREVRGGSPSTASLNEIIFDHGDMSEGLMMRDNEGA